ncbi:MAG: PRC-barrel domain-containing protein [Thermoproteota archaeon]|nr:PRC-barrel domain-containing protein [Thermoproteota archaeon]
MSIPLDQDLLERPVYTKDDEYVGAVEDLDNENGKLIIRGRNDMRSYSIPASFMVNADNGRVLLDMARDDFIEYEV